MSNCRVEFCWSFAHGFAHGFAWVLQLYTDYTWATECNGAFFKKDGLRVIDIVQNQIEHETLKLVPTRHAWRIPPAVACVESTEVVRDAPFTPPTG